MYVFSALTTTLDFARGKASNQFSLVVRSLLHAKNHALCSTARRFVGGRLPKLESAHQAKLPGFAAFLDPSAALDQQQPVECVPSGFEPAKDFRQWRERPGHE